jgi:hypothetical protein
VGFGGGSSSSGKKDWPDYMKTIHGLWLDEVDAIVPITNPYTGLVSYDPATVISNLSTSLTNFVGYYSSIGNTLSTFKSAWSDQLAIVASNVTPDIVAELDISKVLKFEGEMRDINAVQTSSFGLGKSMLYAKAGLEAAKLTLINTAEVMSSIMSYGEQLRKQFTDVISYSKIVAIAYKEQHDFQVDIDAEEVKWPLYGYREAGALLGSIGSAAVGMSKAKPNKGLSAAGGAVSGAVTGAYIGSVYPGIGTVVGAVVGAIIGGIGGYLSAQ